MRTRRLTLKREALTDLTGDDLRDVVGAAVLPPTTPVKDCLQNSRYVCTGTCNTNNTCVC